MDFDILSVFSESISLPVLKCFLFICLSVLAKRLIFWVYAAAVSAPGTHYVNLERRSLQMFSSYNPFSFEATYTTASYSGIKCNLKSDQACYVQAFWGVPIYPLFQLLHGDWQALRNAIITHIPAEKFSSKCICANDPLLLPAGEEKSVEFKPRWHTDETTLSQEATYMRDTYPFVVLMVLKNRDEIHESFVLEKKNVEFKPRWHTDETTLSQEATYMRDTYPFVVLMVLKNRDEIHESCVVSMANAIHVPDKHLNLYSQLIGQYIKLASGHVGQIRKIFLSSPATSDDDGDSYDLCLACYHRPVSMVFLPCCHACLCSACFDLCERCPVCRAASMHYFELPDTQKRSDH